MTILYIIIAVIAYLLIGLILIGMEKRWDFPYSIVEKPENPMDKILVFIWPVGLITVLISIIIKIVGSITVLISIIVKIVEFFFNGFRWSKGAK